MLGLECQAPAGRVQTVEGDGLRGGRQRATRVAVGEACVTDANEQVEERGMQTAYLTVCPRVVAAGEWFAAPQRGGSFERNGFALGVGDREQPVELVEVDAYVAAVELVALAVVEPGVAEGLPGLGHRLPEELEL